MSTYNSSADAKYTENYINSLQYDPTPGQYDGIRKRISTMRWLLVIGIMLSCLGLALLITGIVFCSVGISRDGTIMLFVGIACIGSGGSMLSPRIDAAKIHGCRAGFFLCTDEVEKELVAELREK